jgi:hypothetical protein
MATTTTTSTTLAPSAHGLYGAPRTSSHAHARPPLQRRKHTHRLPPPPPAPHENNRRSCSASLKLLASASALPFPQVNTRPCAPTTQSNSPARVATEGTSEGTTEACGCGARESTCGNTSRDREVAAFATPTTTTRLDTGTSATPPPSSRPHARHISATPLTADRHAHTSHRAATGRDTAHTRSGPYVGRIDTSGTPTPA